MSSGPYAPPPPPPSGFPPPPSTPPTIEPPSFGGYAGRPGELTGAGFGIRLVARIIDTIAHYIICILGGFSVGIVLGVYGAIAHQPIGHLLGRAQGGGFAFLFALLGSVAYQTVCESIHGSSAGKILLSLVVVKEDGTPCTFKPALIRSLAYFIDGLFFGLIGYMAMNKSPQQQRHGDGWAGTVVCKRAHIQPQNLHGGGRFVLGLFCAIIADAGLFVVGLILNMLS